MTDGLAVILHGGAGRLNEQHSRKKVPFLIEARDKAWEVLTRGGSGGRAVAAALRVMEGCQYFNAGYGGYPNMHGIVLLDVGLMRGDGDFVSIVNLRKVKYPSAVAYDMLTEGRALTTVWTRELMQEVENATPELKEHYGLVARHEDLVAPFVKQLLGKEGAAEVGTNGTVGCVVRDSEGKIFAGTSTGGVNLKTNGRIGDTPIIGAGVFSDDELCGLSTTGHGETFLRNLFSGFVNAEVRRHLRLDSDVFRKDSELAGLILKAEMEEMMRKSSGKGGGIILLPAGGRPVYAFNSEMISVAFKGEKNGEVYAEDAYIALKSGEMLRSTS